MKMSPAARAAHPCIGASRTDFILSGCAIFEAIARTFPIDKITIADRGVREGIIVSLMREMQPSVLFLAAYTLSGFKDSAFGIQDEKG